MTTVVELKTVCGFLVLLREETKSTKKRLCFTWKSTKMVINITTIFYLLNH